MPKKFVDEVDKRILDMLKQKRERRQTGDMPLVQKILSRVKLPKIKLPKI